MDTLTISHLISAGFQNLSEERKRKLHEILSLTDKEFESFMIQFKKDSGYAIQKLILADNSAQEVVDIYIEYLKGMRALYKEKVCEK